MHCKHCGKELPEKAAFCPACGTKQATTYREVFLRGNLSEQDFLANINKWFQWHPKAVNITGRFQTDTAVGLLANKYALNQFVIEYELSAEDNPNQYGIVKEESLALTKQNVREFVAQWQAARPNVRLVNWEGGVHSRGHVASHLMGGLGARNRMNVYILFKFPRG